MNNQPDSKYDLVVACIGNNEADENILDLAYKESRQANCPLQVLHISNKKPGYPDIKIQRLLKKASILKAEILKSTEISNAEDIIKYAKTLDTKNNNIIFLIGTYDNKLLRKYFHSTYSQVKGPLTKLGIKVRHPQPKKIPNRGYPFISPIFNYDGISGVLEAATFVLIAFFASFIVQLFLLPPYNLTSICFLVYLTACIVSSVRGGIIPGLLASVLSLMCIAFFNLKPQLASFTFLSSFDVVRLLAFFMIAVTVSLICSGTRKYIIDSRQKEAYLNALLNVSETLNRPLNEEEALAYIHNELEKLFATEIAFFTPALMGAGRLQLSYPATPPAFSDVDKKALEICSNEYRSTGYLTSELNEAKWYFEAMMSANGFQGALAVKLSASPLRSDSNVIGILLGFADLSSTILDRIEHTQTLEENRVTQEKEKLRTMLLASVSHDLKTPLAAIIGSLDVYHNLNAKLSDEAKVSLTETALKEAQRLDSFITNILDMAKLESGSIKFNRDWHKANNLIKKAIVDSQYKLGDRLVKHNVSGNYEIEIDYNMMLRALSHLFDNISKYTPEDSDVSINYGPDENGKFTITIQDTGPGIMEDMLEQIFNKYTRIAKKDSIIAGTGLGLPISRAIIESHGGAINASNNPDKGASFQITLPNYRNLH